MLTRGPEWSHVVPVKQKDQLRRVVKVRLTDDQLVKLVTLAKSSGLKPGTLARIAIVTYVSK